MHLHCQCNVTLITDSKLEQLCISNEFLEAHEPLILGNLTITAKAP